jgi:hypothetical protein
MFQDFHDIRCVCLVTIGVLQMLQDFSLVDNILIKSDAYVTEIKNK